MLLTELPIAEAAISYDTLCCLITVLERAFVLFGRAAAERQRYMKGGVGRDGESGYGEGCVGGSGEMFAGVDEAEGRW